MRGSTAGNRAITLDLWQTLLLDRDGASERRNQIRCNNLSRALRQVGIEATVGQLSSVLKEMSSWLKGIWASDREVTHLDQIRYVLEKASGVTVKGHEEWLEMISSAYVSPIFECPPYLDPTAHRLLRWLKGRNKRIGLICNTGMTPGFALRQVLQREGIGGYFDVMVFSDEVGIRKPDRSIFSLTATQLDVLPNNVIHIGDDLRSDVWGAKNAGSRAIFLLRDVGRDKVAEGDPTSLVYVTRELSKGLRPEEVTPDEIVDSIERAMEAIEKLDP
jgi:putative hydrolase of the HAD superfamily